VRRLWGHAQVAGIGLGIRRQAAPPQPRLAGRPAARVRRCCDHTSLCQTLLPTAPPPRLDGREDIRILPGGIGWTPDRKRPGGVAEWPQRQSTGRGWTRPQARRPLFQQGSAAFFCIRSGPSPGSLLPLSICQSKKSASWLTDDEVGAYDHNGCLVKDISPRLRCLFPGKRVRRG